jgi:TRAP-type transport system periplasmic protein
MGKGILNFVTVLFVFVIAFMFVFSGSAFAYSKEKPLVLKAAIDNPSTDIKARTIKRLGDLIEKKTNGRIKFEYFYGGSLISKPAFIDAVARDIADISTGPASFVTGKIPELSPFNMYGAYDLSKYLGMAKAIWPTLTGLLADKNIHPIMLQYTGNNIFCHRTMFLKTPADWKGQKMRTGGRWQSRLAEMWGASPLFMPPGDLYLALQRGTIDGFLLIFDIVYGLKLYEVAPYITDTGLSNTIEIVTMNLDQWKALSKQDQAIFDTAAKEVEFWNYEETLKVLEEIKKNIVAKGGKIYELNKEEKSLYMKDVNALEPEVAKVSKETGRKFIEILKKFR